AVTVLTSEGDGREGANETNVRWCTMGGPLEGGWGGVTIMDHPGNVRHPNRVRVHPGVPYFGFMLPQAGDYTIAPGQPLTLRYRIVVHAKMPDAGLLDGL
ncbi:MAG: PmoA family protein, partial [Armatimonadota bacterium]